MMRARFLLGAATLFAGSGCIVVSDDTVLAGDPLDAYFVLTWTTTDAPTGIDLDCSAAGADTVRVRARNVSTGDVVIDLFDCQAEVGTTYALTAGDYSVNVALVNCLGDPSCSAPLELSSITVPDIYRVWANGDYDLGHIVFMVD